MAHQQAAQHAEVEKSVSVSFVKQGLKKRVAHMPKPETTSPDNQCKQSFLFVYNSEYNIVNSAVFLFVPGNSCDP